MWRCSLALYITVPSLFPSTLLHPFITFQCVPPSPRYLSPENSSVHIVQSRTNLNFFSFTCHHTSSSSAFPHAFTPSLLLRSLPPTHIVPRFSLTASLTSLVTSTRVPRTFSSSFVLPLLTPSPGNSTVFFIPALFCTLLYEPSSAFTLKPLVRSSAPHLLPLSTYRSGSWKPPPPNTTRHSSLSPLPFICLR